MFNKATTIYFVGAIILLSSGCQMREIKETIFTDITGEGRDNTQLVMDKGYCDMVVSANAYVHFRDCMLSKGWEYHHVYY